MDNDATSSSPAASPRTDTVAATNEAELSRSARQAIHQPADPRLDRQLAWMGLAETPVPARDQPREPTGEWAPASEVRRLGSEVQHLDARLRRIEFVLGAVVAVVGVVALLELVLILR